VIPTWASSTLAAAIAGISKRRCALPSRLARRTDMLPIGQRGRQDRPRHHQRLTRLAYVSAKEDGKIYARARCSIRIFRQAISRRGPDANGIFSQDARPGAASGGALTYLNWALAEAHWRTVCDRGNLWSTTLGYASNPVCVSGCSIGNWGRPRSFRPEKTMSTERPK
jgi:hypothetical protein